MFTYFNEYSGDFFLFGIIWVFLFFIISFLIRKKRGKLIFGDPQVHKLFKESSASGHSNKNTLTRLGGARNCLKVILSDDQIIITPFFPFNLLFLPEIYDLEHFINYNDVIQIGTGFMKSIVIVFRYENETKEIVLRLKRSETFLSVLKTKLDSGLINA